MNGVMLKKIASGYFTDMREIFDSLDQVQLGYNWLLSDYECNSYPAEMPFNQPFVWLSGAELTRIISAQKIQFIWGTFSAFDPLVTVEEVLAYPLPCGDGNAEIWLPEAAIQHPLAQVEMISWDSSYFLLRARSNELIQQFQQAFPQAGPIS